MMFVGHISQFVFISFNMYIHTFGFFITIQNKSSDKYNPICSDDFYDDFLCYKCKCTSL